MKRSGTSAEISRYFSEEYRSLKRYTATRLDSLSEWEPEEIVHEVFTRLLDKPDLTIPLGELAAYIYGSIRNLIIDRWRSGKRRAVHDSDSCQEIPDERTDFLAEMERQERYDLIDEALSQLSEPEREVVEAVDFDGFTYRELEQMWDIPAGTLMSRKKRALDKVRKYCKEALHEE